MPQESGQSGDRNDNDIMVIKRHVDNKTRDGYVANDTERMEVKNEVRKVD